MLNQGWPITYFGRIKAICVQNKESRFGHGWRLWAAWPPAVSGKGRESGEQYGLITEPRDKSEGAEKRFVWRMFSHSRCSKLSVKMQKFFLFAVVPWKIILNNVVLEKGILGGSGATAANLDITGLMFSSLSELFFSLFFLGKIIY